MKRPARILAPASLAAAAVLFAATLPFRDSFIGALLHAFAEAAMIGGLADWFAVVALFRHPFGIPIPHTAIIPRHRRRLTDGIVETVQNSWLRKESLRVRVEQVHIAPIVAAWLTTPSNRRAVRDLLRSLLRGSLRAVDTDELVHLLRSRAAGLLTPDDLMRAVERVGRFAVEHRWMQTLLDGVLRSAPGWLASAELHALLAAKLHDAAYAYAATPMRRIGRWLAERTGTLSYDDLATSLCATVGQQADEILADPEHPFRPVVDAWALSMLARLDGDAEARSAVSQRILAALNSEAFDAWLRQAGTDVVAWMVADLDADASLIIGRVDAIIDAMLPSMQADTGRAAEAERWIKDRVLDFLDANHGEIGRIVRDNLDALDDRDLVRLIESRVGADLQYIRVNGAVIGGIVGALLFLLRGVL